MFMAAKTDPPLTPAQRLNRGLTRTVSGPVDVTRGVAGLATQTISSAASGVRGRYRASKLRRDLGEAQSALRQELTAAQEAVTNLPHVLAETRADKRGKPRLRTLATAAGVTVLAGGAAAFSAVRHTVRPPEASPLPPSVDVDPKP
jgi:Cell wall synthesis protein CwsA